MDGQITRYGVDNKGVPEINFQLRIQNREEKEIRVLGYTISLTINNLLIDTVTKLETKRIGQYQTIDPLIKFYLDPMKYKILNRSRKEDDLKYSLSMSVLTIKNSGNEMVTSSFNAINISFPLHTKFSQKEWFEITRDMGYSNIELFEIKQPNFDTIPEQFKIMITRLREAQKLRFEGKNEEMVTKCRKALEKLHQLVNDQDILTAEMDLLCPGKGGEDPKSTRIGNVKNSIWRYVQVGPHEGYNVTREDADYIFYLTLSTVRYYCDIFTKVIIE